MLAQGLRHGSFMQFINSQEVQFSAAGSITRIVFDKGFEHVRDGYILCCTGLTLALPPVSFTPGNSSMGDGCTYAQLVQSSTLEVADGSPPHLALGSRALWENLDGPRLFHMLDWMSGGVPFVHQGNSNLRLVPSGVDQTSETGYNALKRKIRSNLLQNQGPYHDSDSAAQATSWNPIIHFAIGRRYGERVENTAVPLTWLAGECGPCGTGTGNLQVTLATSMDNNALTWTTATKGALYLHLVQVPAYRVPAPQVPYIFTRSDNQQVYESKKLVRSFLGILPPLDAEGDMPTSTYTRVSCRTGGTEDINPLMSEHLGQIAHLTQSGVFGDMGTNDYDTTQTAMTHNARTRLVRWGLPLLLHRGSIMFAPGSIDTPSIVKFETHSETTHHVVDAGWVPLNDAADARLAAFSGVEGGMVKDSTRNGKGLISSIKNFFPKTVEGALSNAKNAIVARTRKK